MVRLVSRTRYIFVLTFRWLAEIKGNECDLSPIQRILERTTEFRRLRTYKFTAWLSLLANDVNALTLKRRRRLLVQ